MEEKTDVIFRKFKDGSIIAIFPYEIAHKHFVMSYEHLGQHSSCEYDYIIETTSLAKENEYKHLKDELENYVGYNLNIIKKRNYGKYINNYRNNLIKY